jgi:uncharacterized tellurite resistance protein B-like protein
MLSTIKNFFDTKLVHDEQEESSLSVSKIDLVCAALLIEVINSDHELDERESKEFMQVISESLDVSDEDLNELVELAEAEAHKATSLYEFTRLINDEYDYEEKCGLIEKMWRIAFSDEQLDKYEEHLIRKISELIYVSHSDFIRGKLKVKNTS